MQFQPFGADQADVGLGQRKEFLGADEFREFQHVFEQRCQGRGAFPYLFLIQMPGCGVFLGQHQFRKTVDGVQGRAYLVAHRVDERRLHLLALLGAAALALRLLVGGVRQPFRPFQPPDHDAQIDAPTGQKQQDDAAGDEQVAFVAHRQPGLFELEAVDVEQGLHLGQVPLRFVHAVVIAVFVALPHGFERLFVIAGRFNMCDCAM